MSLAPEMRSGFRRIAAALVAVAGMAASLGIGPARAEVDQSMRLASIEPVGITEAATANPGQMVRAEINLSDQTMHVYVGDRLVNIFPISSGRSGYGTPPGKYKAEWLSPKHRSRKYDNAPMPWAVFFHGGYAIHGTDAIRRLGRPASHGCIRLHPDNAKLFYSLVLKNGRENTLITIVR
jgi:lipoprotein-anchoring transpeptidase ErfK/SrfK